MTKVEEKSFMKNKTKYLITTFIMVLSFMLVGFTNVNAATTTADVEDRGALINTMNDTTTDIVRLNKDIDLTSEVDTIFYIEKSKTLDLNGHTITVPDGKTIKFWYYKDADIKIINSSNSSSAKIIANHTGAPTYHLLYGAMLGNTEKVNFEIDGVDFEVKNNNFTTVATLEGDKKYENLIIKNSNVIGNQYLFWYNTAKKVYLESIKLDNPTTSNTTRRSLSNDSNLTINDVIDANAVVEYYSVDGVRTADRTAKLDSIDTYYGPITVKFAKGFKVSNVELNGVYGETPEANISIKNVGENALQVKSVTVSDTDKFEIIGSTQPTVDAGATNTDFKVKAKSGLNAGEYTATITVTDASDETYTATVTLKVNDDKVITEIRLTGGYQYGNVPAGILPAFNPGTTTDNISIDPYNSDWSYFMSDISTWSRFGADTPVAYNDGNTKYGYDFNVKTNAGYELAPNSNLKVFYNEGEVTSTVAVRRYAWGAYVTVDLGKAIGENPTSYTVTFETNGGTEISPKTVVDGLKIKEPSTPTKDKYVFRGWYKDDAFNTKFDFNTPITSNITLYAKWEAANTIDEIRLTGDYEYGNVPAGTLPAFNPGTTTDNISIGLTGSDWEYFRSDISTWSGFGSETPVAYNDGKTKYGYRFQVKTNDGYQLNSTNLKVFYNEKDVTSTVAVNRWAWGAYVIVDLGKATGGTPTVSAMTVSDVTLTGIYGETPEANISIQNVGDVNLKVISVAVSDTDKFEIIGSTQPTVDVGATNTDFKVKAKTGLNAGEYTATITVTDTNDETYTATVTLKVDPKQLTGLGISGLDGTWVYGTTKTPTATGVEGLTAADDYEIVYSKKNEDSTYTDLGTELPKLVGEYKATLKIKNSNYTASEASVDFSITSITTEVKVKSYDETFTYDGTEHAKDAYDVLWANNASPVTDKKLPNGDKVTAEITGKVRDVKDTAIENNTIGKITITNAEGVDVSDCYSNIVRAAGKLTVNPITTPIVVTADSDTKAYDGTDLTKDTYTYTDSVLLTGDTLEVTITGSQKFVGSSKNAVSNVKVMRDGEDITSNYTFGTHLDGTLEVTSADQPLMVADQYVKVNGSISKEYLEQSVTGNEGNIDFTIKSGTALTYNATNEEYVAGATAGDVVMTVTATKVDLGGDGTPEWKETSKDFTIHVINKTDVNITGLNNNEEFTYDGNPKMPTGTISVDAGTINVSDLEVKYEGTGSTTYNSATAPTNVGTYKVTYKVPEDNTSYVGTFSVAFTIKKAQLEKVTLVKDTFEYTGDEIVTEDSNFDSNKMNFYGDIKATNVGNYSITVSLKDKDNYEWKDGSNGDLTINWSITQATPDYTVPTGLTGVKGETLNDVTLPSGFTWNDTTVVLTAGTNTYKATYTPVDTTNYKTITDIDIEVNVKDKFNVITSVNGGNGTITPSKTGVIEGTKEEITFTPNSGYVVSKVMVNGVEKTSEVRNNKIEITVTEEMTVEVTYKRKYTGGGGGSTTTTTYKITVTEGKNGSITPNGVVKVEKGEDQTFKIKAEKGYEIADVLVDGKSVGAVAKYTFKNVKEKHTIEATFKKVEMPEQKPEEKETFKDVKKNDWYYEAVEYVANKGLMNGTGNDEFTPDANTTRGMIVTILYRLEGSPEVSMSTFTDVANTEYYAKAVAWAEKNGIVNGYGEGKFGPNDVITREQLAAIMYRYSNYKKYNTSVGEDTNILSYNDISELSEYAVSSMQWACGAGLVNGIGDGKLAPKGNATRAQLATILMRYCESNK